MDTHSVARCRWCQGPFSLIAGGQWLCTTDACAETQVENAEVRIEPQEGESPYLFLPLPLQVDMRHTPYKRTLVAGAAGACKSFGGRWIAYQQCLDMPGSQVLLLRVSFRQLSDNHLKYMDAEAAAFRRNGVDAKYAGGSVMRMYFNFGKGVTPSQISMGYCDDARDIPQHMGNEWDLIIFEEASGFLPDALSQISSRDRGSFTAERPAGVARDGKVLYLANPGGRGANYLIDTCITKQPDPDDYPYYNPDIHGYFPAAIADNPYLPPDFREKTLSGLSRARYQQLANGDWSIIAGQFFELQQDVHVHAMEAVA